MRCFVIVVTSLECIEEAGGCLVVGVFGDATAPACEWLDRRMHPVLLGPQFPGEARGLLTCGEQESGKRAWEGRRL